MKFGAYNTVTDAIKAAKATLEQAIRDDWPSLTGLSENAKCLLLGQAWRESNFGMTPEWNGSNNWGAVIYHKGDGKHVEHGDHDANGKPYVTQFQAYDSQVAGCKGWLHVILRGAVPTALVNGTARDVAAAMFANHYYTGVSGTPDDRIDAYAGMIMSGAGVVRIHLAIGEGDPDVTVVSGYQEALHRLGLYDDEIDGVAGPKTHAAVLEFQRERGLTGDGIVGPLTQAAMLAALHTSQ